MVITTGQSDNRVPGRYRRVTRINKQTGKLDYPAKLISVTDCPNCGKMLLMMSDKPGTTKPCPYCGTQITHELGYVEPPDKEPESESEIRERIKKDVPPEQRKIDDDILEALQHATKSIQQKTAEVYINKEGNREAICPHCHKKSTSVNKKDNKYYCEYCNQEIIPEIYDD